MLELVVWDVQHGSAIYIKTPNGKHIAIDLGAGGKNGSAFSPLQTLRHSHGVRQLDAVVVTHGHRDHIEDIYSFPDLAPLALYTPRHLTDAEIREGNRSEDMAIVERYLSLRNAYSSPVSIGGALDHSANFQSVDFQLFSPVRASRKNLNDHSLVVVVSYAGLKIIIPGDNEPASWRELLENPLFRTAIQNTDVLIAPHHGRYSGYCSELFSAMQRQPRLVVISDGRFCDTSATSRYCSQVSGWTVFDPFGGSDKRNCITTRNDGHITIKCGWNFANGGAGNFLNVTTSKRLQSNLFATLAALRYGAGPLRS